MVNNLQRNQANCAKRKWNSVRMIHIVLRWCSCEWFCKPCMSINAKCEIEEHHAPKTVFSDVKSCLVRARTCNRINRTRHNTEPKWRTQEIAKLVLRYTAESPLKYDQNSPNFSDVFTSFPITLIFVKSFASSPNQ